MADSSTEKYDVQVINQRYIRSVILESYVNSRKDEFGEDWNYKRARHNRITFTALRKLTDDELDQLQKRSQDASAPQEQSLFID